MSQYPVESNEQLFQAVNYLLSGPGGLGQNFAGFSAFQPLDPADYEYLTGNFRIPFVQVGAAELYVAPVNISGAVQLDDRTIQYTFASAQPSPPFSLGNGITITGIVPASFNTSDLADAGFGTNQIGVIECTTTTVTLRTRAPITTPLGTYVSGGTASYRTTENTNNSFYNSTDCNARVTVTGGTDRIFISAQITQTISYEVLSGPADLSVWVAVRRYVGFPNSDPVNPDYTFELDNPGANISRKIYTFPALSGTGTLPEIETVFSTVIDQPPSGYYWYILEVLFEYPDDGTDIQVTEDQLGLRSLSAQVVKA